ncbi:pirin family protein [Rhizobium lentis]|uniref:pirin family protein n=1 Tax=Rhizobium lentis TaxID=1138194 RepID=UPI001C83DDAC|nr:pirin family protein [Rhizobium lentis]MBX5135389.1 pirin family protein [Rhizobium lentis]
MQTAATFEIPRDDAARIGAIVTGLPREIGNGFVAIHFSEKMFDGRMNPLLTIDHFVMTAPTFDPHLHKGISAVTAIFEDSQGAFLNRDTLRNNVALKPGDLYWLAAASGAVHEEKPEEGGRTHALQIFVDLPERLKREPARALHVEALSMPVIETPDFRIRVVLGRSGHVAGAQGTPEEMTMLDGFLHSGGQFSHLMPEGRGAWIYAVSGTITLKAASESRDLTAGTATTVAAGSETEVHIEANEEAHFVLLAAKPIP